MRPEHARRFARYNRWANARLADAVDALAEADYRADRGLFFGSIHGTLNHLLVADRIWRARLTGAGGVPPALDAILHDARAELRAARACEDDRLVAYVDGLDERALATSIAYRNAAGHAFDHDAATILAHVFNHQTHHRGQVHAALSALGRDAPSLDLIYYVRGAG